MVSFIDIHICVYCFSESIRPFIDFRYADTYLVGIFICTYVCDSLLSSIYTHTHIQIYWNSFKLYDIFSSQWQIQFEERHLTDDTQQHIKHHRMKLSFLNFSFDAINKSILASGMQ